MRTLGATSVWSRPSVFAGKEPPEETTAGLLSARPDAPNAMALVNAVRHNPDHSFVLCNSHQPPQRHFFFATNFCFIFAHLRDFRFILIYPGTYLSSTPSLLVSLRKFVVPSGRSGLRHTLDSNTCYNTASYTNMAVDDAELLALAGGDSSEDDTPQPTTTHRNANSPLPSIEVSQPANSRPTGSKPRLSPAVKISGSSSRIRKSRKDDSEEEGEA